MDVVALGCANCNLNLKGQFQSHPFMKLDDEMLHFLHIFIACEGKIGDMETGGDGLLKKWGSNITAGHHTECKDDQLSLMQIIPYRTFELENLSGERLFWGAREKEFYFNKFELFLCELASGKLTVLEIIDRVVSNFQFNIDRDQLTKDIINYYNGLAKEQLITFRRFS